MAPLLHSGDRILVKKVTSFSVGEIVVSEHPIQSNLAIVKLIGEIDSHGRLKLVGLNLEESSHRFGLIRPERVYGKVTSRLDERPLSR